MVSCFISLLLCFISLKHETIGEHNIQNIVHVKYYANAYGLEKKGKGVAFENRETIREHNIQNIAHLSYYTNANGLLLVVLKKRGSAKFSLNDPDTSVAYFPGILIVLI